MPTSISSPARRPPTGWCSRSASSPSSTYSTPTNMPIIPKRFPELGAGQCRHLRLRRRRLGLHLRRSGRMVPGPLDAARRHVRSLDRPRRRQPQATISTDFANFSGSAKSSAATNCGDIPARSRSPAYSPADAWEVSRTRSPAAGPRRVPGEISLRGARISEAARRQHEPRAGESQTARGVRTRRLGRRQCRAVGIHRYRSYCAGRRLTHRQAMGPSKRHDRDCRRRQRNFRVHEAYLNAGGVGILVGDGKLPHPRSRADHRDLLQLCAHLCDESHLRLSVRRQSWLQHRSRAGERFRRALPHRILT